MGECTLNRFAEQYLGSTPVSPEQETECLDAPCTVKQPSAWRC